MSLPPIAKKGTVDETLQSLNEVFRKYLQAKLDQQQQSASVDLSVIFVDFNNFNTENGKSTVIDFPNRKGCLCIPNCWGSLQNDYQKW